MSARCSARQRAATGAWLLAALASLAACSGSRARRAQPAPAAPLAQVHLGEWFASGSGRCQVSSADRLVTESAALPFPGARVKPDVAALDLSLLCENGQGAQARSREVLPLDVLALLRDPAGRKVAARGADPPREAADDMRSAGREPAPAPDHLVFELPDDVASSVAAPRRFDAASGEPSVARESAVGTLEIRAPSLAVDVLLRPRFYGASFDAFLDALARGLAHGDVPAALAADESGADALRALATLYAEVQGQFEAARFELLSAAPIEARAAAEPAPDALGPPAMDSGQNAAKAGAPAPAAARSEAAANALAPRIAAAGAREPEALLAAFALSRPRRSASGVEIARFELRLARDKRAGWRVAGFENREAARQILECRELDAELEGRLARAHGAPNPESCNALGLLVPGSCAHADQALIERVLAVRARCHVPRAPEQQRAPPPDFQLGLRRGRPERGLDRHPRYLLTLFPTGQVVFHGRHWVSTQERSDGRTTRALVAGLYGRLLALDWFGRRASPAARACTQSEQGDLISVHANGRERTVIDRAGCRDPFSEVELSDLKHRVELIAGVLGWTAPRPGYADDKVEHWTLAESATE